MTLVSRKASKTGKTADALAEILKSMMSRWRDYYTLHGLNHYTVGQVHWFKLQAISGYMLNDCLKPVCLVSLTVSSMDNSIFIIIGFTRHSHQAYHSMPSILHALPMYVREEVSGFFKTCTVSLLEKITPPLYFKWTFHQNTKMFSHLPLLSLSIHIGHCYGWYVFLYSTTE